jgi:hypothetical protein
LQRFVALQTGNFRQRIHVKVLRYVTGKLIKNGIDIASKINRAKLN